MTWRVANSLEQLRKQINEAFPNRDKTSDGGIGDAAHASRSSDHNPWLKDAHGVGVVTARDFDEDLSSDIHSIESVITAIRVSRDPRVKYIIYEGRITEKGSDLQRWVPYHGVNAHKHHAHISVFPDPKLYDNASAWDIGVEASASEPSIPVQPARQTHTVVAGDTLWALAVKYGTNVAAIKEANGLTSDVIKIGQKLAV